MLEGLIASVQAIVVEYGALGVFLATLIEEIVVPVPSPLVPLAAGFFLLPAQTSVVAATLKGAATIALPVAVGIGIGSSAVYGIGYYGGKPTIERWQRRLGVSWQDIESAERRFRRGGRDEIVLLILRILPVVPGVAVSGLCGIIRYPYLPFALVTLLGAFIRALVLAIVGWQVGELYGVYAKALTRFENYVFLGLVVAAVLAFGGLRMINRKRARREPSR